MKNIYSVSRCISEDFFQDWIDEWQHNGYWLFNSPQDIEQIAEKQNISLTEMTLFFYSVYEYQWHEVNKRWMPFEPEPSFETKVAIPKRCQLQGFDVVSFSMQNWAECSPLSCNALASEIKVNSHCLFDSFQQAKEALENGTFDHSEPGPFRIFAVYMVNGAN